MEVVDLDKKIGFSEVFTPRMLRMAPGYKVPLICMEPGQAIDPHQGGVGIFYVVSGAGVMTLEGGERDVRAGNMIFVEEGETRGIRATERLVAFAVGIG